MSSELSIFSHKTLDNFIEDALSMSVIEKGDKLSWIQGSPVVYKKGVMQGLYRTLRISANCGDDSERSLAWIEALILALNDEKLTSSYSSFLKSAVVTSFDNLSDTYNDSITQNSLNRKVLDAYRKAARRFQCGANKLYYHLEHSNSIIPASAPAPMMHETEDSMHATTERMTTGDSVVQRTIESVPHPSAPLPTLSGETYVPIYPPLPTPFAPIVTSGTPLAPQPSVESVPHPSAPLPTLSGEAYVPIYPPLPTPFAPIVTSGTPLAPQPSVVSPAPGTLLSPPPPAPGSSLPPPPPLPPLPPPLPPPFSPPSASRFPTSMPALGGSIDERLQREKREIEESAQPESGLAGSIALIRSGIFQLRSTEPTMNIEETLALRKAERKREETLLPSASNGAFLVHALEQRFAGTRRSSTSVDGDESEWSD